MQTVLGVSITSTGVAWILVDGSAADGPALDHDAFDVDAKADISAHAVAVRGAQAIAAATGHEVRAIGVTYSDDVAIEARQLLASLRESGYGNLVAVPLAIAARARSLGLGGDPGGEMPDLPWAEAQMALARGAAMAVADNAVVTDERPPEAGPHGRLLAM